jgi:hypothetical protein
MPTLLPFNISGFLSSGFDMILNTKVFSVAVKPTKSPPLMLALMLATPALVMN